MAGHEVGCGSCWFFGFQERGGAGKRRGTKPLLPLLRVQGKKEHNAIQNDIVLCSFFFLDFF
jgi:hypothetical protein